MVIGMILPFSFYSPTLSRLLRVCNCWGTVATRMLWTRWDSGERNSANWMQSGRQTELCMQPLLLPLRDVFTIFACAILCYYSLCFLPSTRRTRPRAIWCTLFECFFALHGVIASPTVCTASLMAAIAIRLGASGTPHAISAYFSEGAI